jgi:hypothetical protein
MRKIILVAGAAATLLTPVTAMAKTSHHPKPHKGKHHATKRHTSRIVHGARGPKGVAGPAGAPGKNGQDGAQGAAGQNGHDGAQGPAGQNGQNGQKGDSYLTGAYYSVAYYDKGDTNGGAIATVACKAPTDTAISGGVSTDDYTKTVPVGQSFPGRMDWSTNTPKANRLDGWIIQFATQNGSAPEKVKVWALCVPGLNVSASQTYTQSTDG